MIGTVFGRNNGYGISTTNGNVASWANTRLLALAKSSSATLLDGALSVVSWQSSVLASKSSTNRYGRIVDVFA